MEPQSSPQEKVDSATATFRKPSTDAGNRIYRRRSPVGGSSSSEGSPTHERNSSPIRLSKDSERTADDRRRKDEGRDSERHSGRSRYGRSGDSYRHSDRRSLQSSRSYHRDDDHHRRDKYVDADGDHSRSSRSGRDSRSNTYSDYSRREGEHRSRDHARDDDRYSGDKLDGLGDRSRGKEREKDSSFEYQRQREKDSSSDRTGSGRRRSNSNNDDIKHGNRDGYTDDKVSTDEKLDNRRSSGDYRSDRGPSYEESRAYKNDSSSRRDSSGHRLRESSRSDVKSLDSEKYTREEKNSDNRERYKERHRKESGDKSEDGNGRFSKDQESSAKKQKLINVDESNTAEADEKNSVSLKQAQEVTGKGSAEQACLTDSDIDAAKVAAMKAAELVNRNLVGTGFMSADQKKKLLWGNKKTAVADESANRWDTTKFGDRERQEKFHKLMSLRLHWYLWPIVGCEGRNEGGEQFRQRSCREAEGAAPDGFREAIYGWIASKRWSHCRSRSLKIYLVHLLVCEIVFGRILLYNFTSIKLIDVAPACRICDLWFEATFFEHPNFLSMPWVSISQW